MQIQNAERRRWERYAIKIRTKITISRSGKSWSIYGEATDVSRGGLKLFIPRDLESGFTILMELSLPYQSQQMAIRGILRNRSGFSYGIEFVNPTPYEQDTIAKCCKALRLMQ
ncbi:MAG: PilZ domain-containing protein [Candidatus Sulfotelmatobacter sp.]